MPFAGFKGLILPSVLIVLILMGMAWIADRRSIFYRQHVDRETSGNRFHAIDGLRGFLAIAVLFHHSVISFFFYTNGVWTTPPSRVATLYGQGGVALFFMVTALLFWSRALASEGRVDLSRFVWSRITRVVPMYVVASGALILTALALSHFRLVVAPWQLAKDSAAWLLFMFFGAPAINGYKYTGLINTVFWTLIFEWKFYFLFPILSFFARGWLNWLVMAAAAFVIHWYTATNVEWYFVYGALAATLLKTFPACKRLLTGPAGSIAVITLLMWIYKSTPTAYDPQYEPLFFMVFLIIAAGNNLFGILTCRPARVLGTISYSIYLLHNYVLFLVSRLVNHFTDVAQLPSSSYWLMVAVVAIITIGLSMLTYKFIEHPFLKWKQPALRNQGNASVASGDSSGIQKNAPMT
jgi:peptidoglycan/LPS O-acetylase OafA/YrhL